MKPTISVVMPVYNGEKYLKEAIESILNQSFKDFELILINDGSTDSSTEIVKSFNDQRIVFIDNGGNIGLSKSFNKGIALAKGTYIARMDADDIATPERLEKQLKYLEANPEIDILGSAITIINEHGQNIGKASKPLTHEGIKWQSLFSTPLLHPTVMARAQILKNHTFNENLHNSEDYELWSRLLWKTETRFANLSEALLKYRVFPQSFTRNLKSGKREASAQNSISNLSQCINLSEAEKALLISWRREERLNLKSYWNIWQIYNKAARVFGPNHLSLRPFSLSLIKDFIRGLLR